MSAAQEKKFAIIGFGKLGLLHSAMMNGLPGCRLTSIVDNSKTVLQLLSSQMSGITTYSDHKKLLKNEKIDAALITTPSHLHVDIAKDLVEAGVAILIEKPLSISSAQARPLLELFRKQPVPNLVGYMSRYLDTFIKAKKILDDGVLGRIHKVRSNMYIAQLFREGKGWRYKKENSGGGVLITQNSHLIDALLWMFGDIESVSGHTTHLYSKEVEDGAHAFLNFKAGFQGWIDTCWSEKNYRTLTMHIHVQGENGTLTLTDDDVSIVLDEAKGEYAKGINIWKKPDLFDGVVLDLGGPHYTRQALDFLDILEGKEKQVSDIESAFKVQSVIDAIYESAEQKGAPVTVEYN